VHTIVTVPAETEVILTIVFIR